jgi:hypothetical protein
MSVVNLSVLVAIASPSVRLTSMVGRAP